MRATLQATHNESGSCGPTRRNDSAPSGRKTTKKAAKTSRRLKRETHTDVGDDGIEFGDLEPRRWGGGETETWG